MVRKGGLEPPRSCERQPLKLVRLPIPPLPQQGSLQLSAVTQGEAFGDSRTNHNKPLTTDDYYFFGA